MMSALVDTPQYGAYNNINGIFNNGGRKENG